MRLVHPLLLSLRPLLLSAFVPRRMEFFAGGVLEKPSQAVPLFTAEDERRARERVAPSADGGDDGALTVATWNLLAPPFYRHPSGGREAETPSLWRERLGRIADQLDAHAAHCDVVMLQEFWFDETFVELWRARFAERFALLGARRGRGKPDGVVTMVAWRALARGGREWSLRALDFNDWGDRVAAVVDVRGADGGGALSLVNTHLTFPHASAHDPLMRKAQARKLAEWLDGRRESALVVAGDFNGDLADAACADLLRLTGLAPHSTDPFVSHVSHRGDLMGCDFVLTRPPQAAAGGPDLACRDVALHGTVEQMRAREWPSDHSLLVVRLGGRAPEPPKAPPT